MNDNNNNYRPHTQDFQDWLVWKL